MTILILLLAVGLLTLVLAVWAFQAGPRVRNLSELERYADPVDLRFLANLFDPRQERFVKGRLSKWQFLQFKIMRFRTASRYIACTSRNAALLLSIGRSAAKSSSSEIATAGRDLADAALQVRLYSILARFSLAVQIVLPSPFKSLMLLMRNYGQIKDRVTRLSTLESSSPTVLRYL